MPIPRTLLLTLNQTFYGAQQNIISPQEAMQSIEESGAGGIFVKYEIGDRGNTISYLRRMPAARRFQCGEEAVDMQFLDRMRLRGNFLFEEAVVQHPATAAFHAKSVNTFRVATQFVQGKGAKILLCAFRMGRGGAVMDNASKGGIFAGIDVETGAMYEAAYDVGGNSYDAHPDSGIAFKGQSFGFMGEIFELCMRGANVLPTLPSIGWDIAYTDGGPVVIEANDNWGLSLFQFPNGGIADILEREWNIRWH